MGEMIRLTAADGFTLSAYKATPVGKPKGALVVIQEIFGVNRHMRGQADGFARDGYVAIVPALFDRIRPGIELGYAEADIAEGRQLKAGSPTDLALMDISAARDAVAPAGKVGVIGYCWGGFLTWVTATRLTGFSAAVGYYGGGIGAVANEKPHGPVQMHFGDQDHAIPLSEVEQLRAAHPAGVEVHIYHAGHGFNCDERGSYDAASAKLARERALAFLGKHLAGAATAKRASAPAAVPEAVPKRAGTPLIAGGTATPKAPAKKAKAKPRPKVKQKRRAAPKRKAAKKPSKKRAGSKRKFLRGTARRLGRLARRIGRIARAPKALRRR